MKSFIVNRYYLFSEDLQKLQNFYKSQLYLQQRGKWMKSRNLLALIFNQTVSESARMKLRRNSNAHVHRAKSSSIWKFANFKNDIVEFKLTFILFVLKSLGRKFLFMCSRHNKLFNFYVAA